MSLPIYYLKFGFGGREPPHEGSDLVQLLVSVELVCLWHLWDNGQGANISLSRDF